MSMERYMSPDEKVIFEDKANYIGGCSIWPGPDKGSLVLTNKRLFFEGILGGLREKRPALVFEVTLNKIMEAKVGKLSLLSSPVLSIVYRTNEGKLEQPSFQVDSPDSWKAALSNVKVGGFF